MKGPETFGVPSDLGNSARLGFQWGSSLVSPHTIPHTVPEPILIRLKTPWQARNISLGRPEAPAKQIPAVRRRLCPRPRAPSHALAPPTLPSRFLGHALCHTAAVTPTSSSIAMPSRPSPRPPSPEHHPGTHLAAGPQHCAAGGPKGAGRRRSAMGEG